MRNIKIIFVFSLLALGVFWSWQNLPAANAQSDSTAQSIQFPIAELGNCGSKEECRTYCDDLNNKNACVAFGEAHGLISAENATRVRALPSAGPGDCRSDGECRNYCADTSHADECLVFAEKHNLLDKEKIQKARIAIEKTGPGGCRGQDECRNYCADTSHADECLVFAKNEGLISDKEESAAREVLAQGGPGGCHSKEECRTYCDKSEHLEECLAFGEKHGFISSEEISRLKKTGFIKTGPGGCQGEECRVYCDSPEHQQECIIFAEEHGLMSPEEAARARKFRELAQKEGPGGCQGEECRIYCEKSENQDVCFAFAKENNLVTREEEQNFEAGRKLNETLRTNGGPGGCVNDEECKTYCSKSDHAEECVAFAVAHGGVTDVKAREMLKRFIQQSQSNQQLLRAPAAEAIDMLEEKTLQKFEEFKQLEKNFRRPEILNVENIEQEIAGEEVRAFRVGPGGCSSPAECIKYCSEHKNECFNFGEPGRPDVLPPEGGVPPGRVMTPNLKTELIKEVRLDNVQIPEFKSEEEKRRFFQNQFETTDSRPVPLESFKPSSGNNSGEQRNAELKERQKMLERQNTINRSDFGGQADSPSDSVRKDAKDFKPFNSAVPVKPPLEARPITESVRPAVSSPSGGGGSFVPPVVGTEPFSPPSLPKDFIDLPSVSPDNSAGTMPVSNFPSTPISSPVPETK